ncbi:MAG: siphovirus Gp157 family protein [Firmicutes bacterium]|nr:siphovirus Gp157 family protein [Bacillota bacterium]
MKLYEISEKYYEVQTLAQSEEIDQQAIIDTLDSIEAEFNEKADGIACVIKNLQAEESAIEVEIKQLEARKKAKSKAIERLIEYLKSQMIFIGKYLIETARNRLKVKKNRQSTDVFDEAKFISWAQIKNDDLLNYGKPTPNKTKIKEAIESGKKIPFAKLIQTERLEIK